MEVELAMYMARGLLDSLRGMGVAVGAMLCGLDLKWSSVGGIYVQLDEMYSLDKAWGSRKGQGERGLSG